MDDAFLSVITARHCKRAFLDRPVPPEILERVLTVAGNAPSPRNTQFWQVAVVSGDARVELSRRLLRAAESTEHYEHDYANRPVPMGPLAERRAFTWGAGYYGAMGIARADKAGRQEVERRNLRFYEAPVAMVFHLPTAAVAGTFLEMGFFVQNVMLGLVAAGLGSCPQYSVARYADVLRDTLSLGPDRLVVCTLCVGYVDETAPINSFHPERIPLRDYTAWYDNAAAVSGPDPASLDHGGRPSGPHKSR